MATAYAPRLLWVDLGTGQIETRDVDPQTARKFIGGSGLGAKTVFDETSAATDPLTPETPLIFMTGPFTGTVVPGSSRVTVASLSPLTGIWGEAHAGGSWPDELKKTGFDGIVVRGKAKAPVYLWVQDGQASLRDASHLWGRDTYEVSDLIRRETAPDTMVMAIGPAGERLVKVASLISGGQGEARAAARCGLGAVMGSKHLKAVAVRGTHPVAIADPEGLRASVKRHWGSKLLVHDLQHRMEVYRDHALENCAAGKNPIKNFREGEFPSFAQAYAAEVQKGEPAFCRGCRTSCLESGWLGDRRRTMASAMEMLGSCCMVDDMAAVGRGYHLCNRLGVDTKSTGVIIAFAMECFERGLITTAETDGVRLEWGSGEAMVRMVEKIGLREGFGAVLAQGVRKAAETIGHNAIEYAMHVKGLEYPNHDPRSSNYRALALATSNIGADQVSSLGVVTKGALPELGIKESEGDVRFSTAGKGEAVANLQNFGALINSMGICTFALYKWLPDDNRVPPSACVEWLNLVTGWDMSLQEFLRCGERTFNLQRMIGVRRGISRKDDALPPRFLTEKLRNGANAGRLPPFHPMLGAYYRYRGWSEEGLPTREKLEGLGLPTG